LALFFAIDKHSPWSERLNEMVPQTNWRNPLLVMGGRQTQTFACRAP
jgi:hypothetical protein